MRILVNYVIQGEDRYRFDSEIVDFNLSAPLYSPLPADIDVDREIIKWLESKQLGLSNNEKIIVMNSLKA